MFNKFKCQLVYKIFILRKIPYQALSQILLSFRKETEIQLLFIVHEYITVYDCMHCYRVHHILVYQNVTRTCYFLTGRK